MELSTEAVRILGCLIEKERTVPDTYPLTLKALITACNQSSNRWPVVTYDTFTVQRVLDDLKVAGFVRFVHPSHGERTTKYRQVLDEKLGLDAQESAVLCVLALRGPQTIGELRTRTERMYPFAALDEVGATLRGLAGRDEPLVVDIGRRPGEREGRWAHLLSGEPAVDTAPATATAAAPASAAYAVSPEPAHDGLAERVEALEAQVARLYELLGEEPE